MSKPDERRRAIELRRLGLSYREIRQSIPVAKATLSLWLRSVGLARRQVQRLTEKRLAAGRRGAEKVHRERLERVRRTMAEAEHEAASRIQAGDWLWLLGTALYWAEGEKPKEWARSPLVSFTNMDLRMILMVRQWLLQCCSVSVPQLGYGLYIHERADIRTAVNYWAQHLRVPPEELRICPKRHNPSTRRKNTGRSYYGTIRVIVRRSTYLNHRIAGWIRGLTKYCGVV